MRRVLILGLVALVSLLQAGSLPRRGTLGISFRAVPESVRIELKLGAQEAVQVASKANGLEENDLVLGVNGKRFKSFGEWNDLVRNAATSSTVKLIVNRGGKEQEIEVKVQPKPADKGDNYETIYDDVLSNGRRIRTFVTKPKATGKRPVMFWIQGINASSVEAPLTGPSGTSKVLKAFSDDGWVTVRVEKPGVGDSEGGPALLVGFDEELDIYRQTLKTLDKYDFVDRSQVYLFGHSMGGCHAPIIASEQSVKGIISYGTVSDSWLEWQIKAARIQGPLTGQTRAQVDAEVRKTVAVYHYLYNEKRTIAWIKENRPDLRESATETSADGVMMGVRSIKYMQEVNDNNFCDYWAKLGKTRVLALFGEADWISLQSCQEQVASAVNVANPGMALYKVVDDSDHGFNRTNDFKDSFAKWGKPGNEFNPEIIKVMKEWIKSLSS
ncbi:MAG: alpha/beta fold hydrolase [Chlorobia bacterium]|nr:alpha/beta fold hydrolase [Fimbriimonadaceae bacterium]